MSGFVALFDRAGGGVDRRAIRRMLESIDHRGPDGSGTWCDRHIALGHQQLRSTPEARFDDQPYRDGDLVVAGDIRIDNRGELLGRLPLEDPPERIPDSRILLAAYRRWGTNCLDHLVGTFAFAIWDDDVEALFCARDFFGVKPLYYCLNDEIAAFGSEAKAVLALPDVRTSVDRVKVGDFLVKNFEDERRTFHEPVSRLPPAHAMVVNDDGVRSWRYWELDPTRTIELGSDTAYDRRFRELFEQAVRCRLRTSDPVGTTLSGGIDSSSVTVMARNLLPSGTTLHSFSNVYDDAPSSDEREYIEAVTRREGIESHYVQGSGLGLFVDVDDWAEYYDQPLVNNMHFARWRRTERADDVGVGVMLGGALGDQAIGYGLGLLPELFLAGRWKLLYDEVTAMSEVVGASRWEMFRRHVLKNVVPDPVLRARRRLKGRPVLLERANPYLNASFVDAIGLERRFREDRTDLGVVRSDRRDNWRALTSGRKPELFETSDQTAAAFGVEPRYPFADRRLVEFTLAIPPTQQFSNGWTRSIARRALGDLLPNRVQRRPWKTAMNEAFRQALAQEADRLDALLTDPGPLNDYYEIDRLMVAREQFDQADAQVDARRLWEALSLWTWFETHPELTADHRPA